MKVIEAVIQQFKRQEVRDALDEMGVEDFRESSILCHEPQQKHMTFRGARFVASVVEKVKLEIVAADDAVDRIVEVIGSVTKTPQRQECRIAVRPYFEA